MAWRILVFRKPGPDPDEVDELGARIAELEQERDSLQRRLERSRRPS